MQAHPEADRRLSDREIVNATAWAVPGDASPALECLILDLSDDGARLATASGGEFPQTFELRGEGARVPGKVEMIWRRNRQVGVKFRERA